MKTQKAKSARGDSAIDWSEVRRRLDASRAAIKQGTEPDPAEKKKVLKERAKELARQTKDQEGPEESIEVAEFLLAHERYAIESLYVREVYPLSHLTPVPCTPPFVLGIINVRGRILSVIDIKKFFELPEKGLTDLNKVIIVHDDRMEFGILADLIVGVRSIPVVEIQPSLPTFTGIRAEYLKGLTNEPLIILDTGKLLADKRIIIHEEVKT